MNRLDPQNPEELQTMLRNGLGRAILFLMRQDLSQYREMILDTCLHDYAYSWAFEDTRAEYLYPLIKASGEEDYYSEAILQALLETTDPNDAEQLFDLALLLARDGNGQAREAIYEKIRRHDTDSRWLTGDDQLIDLDGIQGLVFALDIIGSSPDLMSTYNTDTTIEQAEEASGTEEVRLALQQAALTNPHIAAALAGMNYSPDWTSDEIIRRREERRASYACPVRVTEDITWEEVKNSSLFRRLIFQWPQLASDEEFEKAAHALNPETEPERLRSHLFLFAKRSFPLDPEPLIRFIDHPSDKVVISALCALELVRHPRVRELFYRLLDNPEWSDRAVGLLRSNYQSGDNALIIDLLKRESDPERLHAICLDTIDVYRDNPIPEGLEPLLLVYEKDPCATCRHMCIEAMQAIAPLPQWLIDECLYDAYSPTRELAAELKKQEPNGTVE